MEMIDDTEEIFAEAQAALADPNDFIDWLYDQIDEGDHWVGVACEAEACPINEYLTDVTGGHRFAVASEGAYFKEASDRAFCANTWAGRNTWVGRFVEVVDWKVGENDESAPIAAQTALTIMREILAGAE